MPQISVFEQSDWIFGLTASETAPARRNRSGNQVQAWLPAIALLLTGLFVFFWLQIDAVGEALRLALPDRDDALRLVGIRDFLAGQSWFDTTQYRYLPPDGVPMHWSRLVDLPIAAGIAGLTPMLGPEAAERIVVAAWPLLLFLVYYGVVGWGALRMFGRLAAGLAVLIAGQMVAFHDVFAAGRIDHHNVQVILIAAAAIAFAVPGRSGRAAAAAGTLCGLSLAVGLEALPFVAIIAFAFALSWIAGVEEARRFSLFGAGLAVTAMAAFLLQTSPTLWLTPACDALSLPWLLLTTGGGLAAVGLVRLTPRPSSWKRRLAIAIPVGLALPLSFALLFPACLDGPYQMVPEPLRSMWLADISEAKSFANLLRSNPSLALQSMMPLLVGAFVAGFAAWQGREHRAALTLFASLLGVGVLLALFQIRVVYIASALLPLVAGWFLSESLAPRSSRPKTHRLFSACLGLLMFGLIWVAVVGAFEAPAAERTSGNVSAKNCDDPPVLETLNSIPPGLVLAQIDLGPGLLLHTPHSIIAAGFHRAPEGIAAGIDAFRGGQGEARRAVEKFGADYLVLCPSWLSRGTDSSFARMLAAGGSVSWLQPLDQVAAPLKAWRILRDR